MGVSQAAICGHDGNVWATSAGFGVTAPELKHIATNFGNMSVMPMSGITVGGTKYMFLSANDKVEGQEGNQWGPHHEDCPGYHCLCVQGACGGRTVCHCHGEAGRIPGGSWILIYGAQQKLLLFKLIKQAYKAFGNLFSSNPKQY